MLPAMPNATVVHQMISDRADCVASGRAVAPMKTLAKRLCGECCLPRAEKGDSQGKVDSVRRG